MKILTIPEQLDVDLGSYGPACEGFVDLVKGLFKKKDPVADRLDALKKDKWQSYSIINKTLEADLKSTYDNPAWVTKTLPEAKSVVTIQALSSANVNQKQITSPSEIVKIAKSMLALVKEIAQSEKPFIEFRRKLFQQVKNISDAQKLDEVWLANEKQLSTTAAQRFYHKHKKPFPALGAYPDGWPVGEKRKGSMGFSCGLTFKTSGEFETPTVHSCKEYADAVRELIDIAIEFGQISYDTDIPYWEGLSAEYDELQYADEIFNNLTTGQDGEVMHLASAASYEMGKLIVGLYIVMFDKHKATEN